MFELDTKTLILANMTRKSDSKTWGGHDRSQTVGASEVGQCQRKLVYDKHNVEPDTGFKQDLGAAERGNVIEDWVVENLQHSLPDDIQLLWATDEGQQTLVDKDVHQSATPDGLFVSDKRFCLKVGCMFLHLTTYGFSHSPLGAALVATIPQIDMHHFFHHLVVNDGT